jgi:hypothetical protein
MYFLQFFKMLCRKSTKPVHRPRLNTACSARYHMQYNAACLAIQIGSTLLRTHLHSLALCELHHVLHYILLAVQDDLTAAATPAGQQQTAAVPAAAAPCGLEVSTSMPTHKGMT